VATVHKYQVPLICVIASRSRAARIASRAGTRPVSISHPASAAPASAAAAVRCPVAANPLTSTAHAATRA
jgi:hypothetical protein